MFFFPLLSVRPSSGGNFLSFFRAGPELGGKNSCGKESFAFSLFRHTFKIREMGLMAFPDKKLVSPALKPIIVLLHLTGAAERWTGILEASSFRAKTHFTSL